MTVAFHLCPATAADLAVAYAITEDAMRGYVEQTWGAWDAVEQLAKHRANFTPETYRMIVVGDAVAGLLAVEDLPTHVWLVKLYLFQRYRGAGLGSQVLRGVIADAQARQLPVRLWVLRVNERAQALYRRHGFRVIEATPERLFMERSPA